MKWSLLITDVSVRNQTTKLVTTHNNTASNNFINKYGESIGIPSKIEISTDR